MNNLSAYTNEPGLWRSVEAELGFVVPEPWRELCRQQGWLSEALGDEEDDRHAARHYVAAFCRTAQETQALMPPPKTVPVDMPPDARWPLLAELSAVYVSAQAEEVGLRRRQWQPLRIRERLFDITVWPTSEYVVVEVDSRVSLRALIAALRQAWPDLRRRGWVRRTRSMGDRAIELVRFVCLQTDLDTTWRDRLTRWNERYPGWAYKGPRAFMGALRRAERQLTEPYGLEWFYSREVRELGESAAARRAKRRRLMEAGRRVLPLLMEDATQKEDRQ